MSEHSESENSDVVNKSSIKKDEPIPILIPERKIRASDKRLDQNFPQTISQSRKNESGEFRSTNLMSSRSENKIIVASQLQLNDWQMIFHNCNLIYGVRVNQKTPKFAFKPLLQFKADKRIAFHVNDKSGTKAHTRTREMESSFASSSFFDGDIGCSCPFVGIGVNVEYLNREASTNTEKKTYVTYCYNFPRADLQLDTSYLEPTDEFIKAIDSVLSTPTLDEQVTQLEKVLSEYGHVYPSSVVLGGHLYHTEEYENKEKAEEARKRITADVSFSPSFIKSIKISAGGGYEERSQNQSSERAMSFTYTAVGGNTLLVQDAGRWAESVAEPCLWRVIEQDEYQSVIELLDKKRREKLQKVHEHFVSKNPNLSKCFSNLLFYYVVSRK
jgi:hypothetical protein